MNLYETTTMLQAVEKMPKANSFLRDTFFPRANDRTFLTESILVDVKKGRRTVAPFVAPKVGGSTMDREGFRTMQITAPKVAPQRVLTVDDLKSRALGESIISTKTPDERAAEILGRDLKELDDMITRREEIMVKELLFDGKISVKGYIDYENKNMMEATIEYGAEAKKPKTPATKWDASGADILKDLRTWRTECIKKSGVAPNILIVSTTVAEKFFTDTKIADLLDKQHINIGDLAPQVLDDATTYIGRFNALGVDVYAYEEFYYDAEAEDDVPLIPDGYVLFGRRDTGAFGYGVITQMEDKDFRSYEGVRVPKAWADEANDRKMLRLSSRPLPYSFDLDAWVSAKVL